MSSTVFSSLRASSALNNKNHPKANLAVGECTVVCTTGRRVRIPGHIEKVIRYQSRGEIPDEQDAVYYSDYTLQRKVT